MKFHPILATGGYGLFRHVATERLPMLQSAPTPMHTQFTK